MPTIDVQVHAYERNHPSRPWVGHIAGPDHVTGDEMAAAMDAVGVNGAILVSPFSLYRYDASYALEVYAAHPEQRTARGRCGSLLLHRSGLAPPTPCRF